MAGCYRRFGSRAALLGALVLSSVFSFTSAQSTQNSTNVPSSEFTDGSGDDKVTVAVNVPEGPGKTDLYFHFEAPADGHSWAAFGMGRGMDKSLIFVVYASADNQGEPTVSPRIGSGHTPPALTNAVNVSVLEGSSATEDKFVVNLHCQNCRNWGSGEVDVTSSSAPFIYALGPSGTLQSDDKNARISKHSSYQSGWSLDMKQATGINGVPIVGGAGGSTDNDDDDDDDDAPGQGPGPGFERGPRMLIIHAFLMGFAFAIVYPGGYLLLRVFERVWLHAGVQTFGIVLTIAVIITGVVMSKRDQISPNLSHPHQVLGFVILALVLITFAVGLFGHMSFRRTQTPHPIMKGHRVLGPLTMGLGFANACVGFSWVGNTRAAIGYAILNLLIIIAVSSLVLMKKKKKMREQAQTSAAAHNFREGQTYPPPPQGMGAPPPPPPYGQSVPMQTFASQGPQEHGAVEYYNARPNK